MAYPRDRRLPYVGGDIAEVKVWATREARTEARRLDLQFESGVLALRPGERKETAACHSERLEVVGPRCAAGGGNARKVTYYEDNISSVESDWVRSAST
jgi:hypothetical protein